MAHAAGREEAHGCGGCAVINSFEWKDVVLDNGLCELKKEIPVHEGTFGLYVYQGSSKDRRYKRYPAWRLFVKVPEKSVIFDNSMAEIRITPGYPSLGTLLRDILVHEFRVDLTRRRKSDFKPKRAWLDNLVYDQLIKDAQVEVEAYNIPQIYYQCTDFSEPYKFLIGAEEVRA